MFKTKLKHFLEVRLIDLLQTKLERLLEADLIKWFYLIPDLSFMISLGFLSCLLTTNFSAKLERFTTLRNLFKATLRGCLTAPIN